MVMTVLEAHLPQENWEALRQAYRVAVEHLPPQIVQTFLLHSDEDSTLWRIVSIWQSHEALADYRRSTATPGGVKVFREAGAEPALSVFDIAAHVETHRSGLLADLGEVESSSGGLSSAA